jgi:glycyl-tRNA synthetase
MPFACAQLGLGFRNEIAPRSGLLRVREFQMAEIEHFVDPDHKDHPKFKRYVNQKIPLLSQECQEKNLPPLSDVTLEEAVKRGIINNETLAYFICRTYLFLLGVGIHAESVRFRQHMKDEMAHYAQDCWDAEIETSYGWIECVGIADRSAYDLTSHSKASKTELMAARKYSKPKPTKVIEVIPDKQKLGKTFKADHKILLNHIEGLSPEELRALNEQITKNGTVDITAEGKTFNVGSEYLKFQEKEVNVMEEKYCPNVIEPSFGVGRIIYCIFEHRFRMRDERRTYIDFPPKIAPIKCSLLPVISNDEFDKIIVDISEPLTQDFI